MDVNILDERVKSYQLEQNELLKEIIKTYWFPGFKDGRFKVELFLDKTCNQACKYCYLTRFGDKLYPFKVPDTQIVENAKMLVDWLIENKAPPSFDIFSGEATIRPMFYKIVNYIIERYHSEGIRGRKIIVPSNYTFLLSDKLTREMEELIIKSRKFGVPLILSASVDGKHMEQNRPLRGNVKSDPRNDEFYDKMFRFNAKWKFGFHPMVYSEGIERWKDNFLWFIKNMKKYNIPPGMLFLLEVRNVEWTKEQVKRFGEFVEWLTKWTFYNVAKGDAMEYLNFIRNDSGFNLLKSINGYTYKGITCSIQTMMYVRVGDLAIVPCHRTSYDVFKVGRFVVDEKQKKIVDIEAYNTEIYLAVIAGHADTYPYCVECPIKAVCNHGCLGSQYEATGDLFTPIPTVCELEITKFIYGLKALIELGLFDLIHASAHKEVKPTLEWGYQMVEKLFGRGDKK